MRFFLFDRVIESQPGSHAVGIKNVSAQEEFFLNHYDLRPVMPAPLIIEALAQLGGWAVAVATDYAFLAVMVMVNDVSVGGCAVPGDQIELRADIQTINDYGAVVGGAARIGGSNILSVGSITYVLYGVPPEQRAGVRQRYDHYGR